MAQAVVREKPRGFGQTQRRDRWWVEPAAIFIGLSAFIVYATWAAFQGEHYHFNNYLSPFYSPELFGSSPHALFGPQPAWWPAILPFSPALLILWAPGGFRFTCYYYRGSYYKAFWADPPSCTVGEPRSHYLGENSFPLIIQNLHRYFLYLAVFFLFFLAYDVWRAMWFPVAGGGEEFGIGVGTLVLAVNVTMLGGYALGCHSMRHLIGGGKDEIKNALFGRGGYNCVSCLNRNHMRWAWGSLFWVMFSDVYVRLCSMGIFTDWRIL